MQLTIEVPTHGDMAQVLIHLSPHVTALEGHVPTECSAVAILTDEEHGVQAPVEYEPSLDDEYIRASVAVADLAALAENKRLTVALCKQRYVINSGGIRDALARRSPHD